MQRLKLGKLFGYALVFLKNRLLFRFTAATILLVTIQSCVLECYNAAICSLKLKIKNLVFPVLVQRRILYKECHTFTNDELQISDIAAVESDTCIIIYLADHCGSDAKDMLIKSGVKTFLRRTTAELKGWDYGRMYHRSVSIIPCEEEPSMKSKITLFFEDWGNHQMREISAKDACKCYDLKIFRNCYYREESCQTHFLGYINPGFWIDAFSDPTCNDFAVSFPPTNVNRRVDRHRHGE